MTDLRRVVLAGGGSAGHVSPLLATADALARRFPGIDLPVLGTAAGLESRLVPARGYTLRELPKVAFPRRPGKAAVRFPVAFNQAIAAAGRVLDEAPTDAVVGFGGYVSTPAYLAARRRGIPVVVHEANAVPGLANRLGARFAAAVATTFSVTQLPGAVRIGLPMRTEITRLDRAALRDEALAAFGLTGERPVVLVTGGSLGAKRLNDAFRDAQAATSAAEVDVLHVTGNGKSFVPEDGTGPGRYVVLEYCDRMDLALSAADLVVCRSGAGMVCETSAVGLPAVFVPLPIGNGEQRRNAVDVVAAGGARIFPDDKVDGAWVLHEIVPLAQDGERLAQMAAAAHAAGERDADEKLVDLVVGAVARRGR